MIIFYDKQSGEIIGTIEGRVHTEDQLKMQMGGRMQVERLVVNWIDPEGTGNFEPVGSDELKKVIIALDKHPEDVFKYKVDTKTRTLVIK